MRSECDCKLQISDCRLWAVTAVAANYRAACRARSRSEFVAKICVVLEEADEPQLWLELIIESKLLPVKRVEPLLGEAIELNRDLCSVA